MTNQFDSLTGALTTDPYQGDWIQDRGDADWLMKLEGRFGLPNRNRYETYQAFNDEGYASLAQPSVSDMPVDAVNSTPGIDQPVSHIEVQQMTSSEFNHLGSGRSFPGRRERIIHGDDDSNFIEGGFSSDRLYGEGGDDVLVGFDGNDLLSGGNGNDFLHAGSGDDLILGDAGNDILLGLDGRDRLRGGGGDDSLRGDSGNDYLTGGSGDDNLNGGDGDDVLLGGSGLNSLHGGEGMDSFELDWYGTAVIKDFAFGEDKIFLGWTSREDYLYDDEVAGFVLGTDEATGFATISGTLSEPGRTRYSGTMAILENITLDQLQAHSNHIISAIAPDPLF